MQKMQRRNSYLTAFSLLLKLSRNNISLSKLLNFNQAIALDNNVDLFVVLSTTGKIARYLAKQRPM